MRHPSEDDLAEFAFDPAASAKRTEIESHIEDCSECSSKLTFIRSVDAGLSDEVAWEISEGFRSVRELNQRTRELAATVAEEDADAERLLSPMLKEPAALAWRNLAELRQFRTGGVVRYLAGAARNECEREPLNALTFADSAVAIAESLDEKSYPAHAVWDLRGTAWKERANALRSLGRYQDALEALDHAELAFRNAPYAPLGPAIITFLRGLVLFERGEYESALRKARNSAEAFERLGDTDRFMRARHLEGNILFYQQDIHGAQAIYESILSAAKVTNDLGWIARESRVLAHCALELGDFAASSQLFYTALEGFTALEQRAEITRTRWGIGCLALSSGNPAEALLRLTNVRAEFSSLGMLIDEALTSFDIMDALIALGRIREIAPLADQLIQRFTDVGMLTSALAALAYLREAAAAGYRLPPVIEHVRKFFRRLEREGESAIRFLPPPDAQT